MTVAELATYGIHEIAVPTPYVVGDVNVFLIDDEPLTLVDCGPNVPGALEALESGFARAGHSLDELDLLLVTHEHLDHLGLVREVAARSGARIACLADLVPYAADFDGATMRDRALADSLMRRHGVGDDVIDRRVRGAAGVTSFETDLVLQHGDEIRLRDRRLRALHAPGHSWTDTLFHDVDNDVLFSGDHLLADISSNALVASRRYGGDDADPGARRPALVEYAISLEQTAEIDVELVLGGHGPTILDHRSLIRTRLEEIEERAAVILDLVRSKPQSAWEVACALWRSAARQPYLALSEVLGHLDLLGARCLVTEEPSGPIARFVAT